MDLQYKAIDAIQQKLAVEVNEKRETQPQNIRLAQELANLEKQTSERERYHWNLRNAYWTRAQQTAKKLLEERTQNAEETPRAKELKSELERLSLGARSSSSSFLRQGLNELYREATPKIAPEIAAKREDQPEVRKIIERLERAREIAGVPRDDYYFNDWEIERAWRGRAHEAAYRLLETLEKSPSEAAPLRAELEKVAAKTRTGNAQKFLALEARRRNDGHPLVTAEEFRVRPGDPLISVMAPRDTQKIVAILPTGEVKTLLWNEATKAFEARFDVPTYALDGDYTVQIVILDALGNRRRLVMNFAVDTSAPSGNAGLFWKDGAPKLRLESDAQTDRVSAFTPWNARVELRRDESGAFTAPLEIPLEWREKAAQIRFVLTDKAHNRTDILVDLAP